MPDPIDSDPFAQAVDQLRDMQDLSTPDRVDLSQSAPKPDAAPAAAPAGKVDPLEEAVDRLKSDQDREDNLQARMLHYQAEHNTDDPEKVAEVNRLSAASGYPPDFVSAHLDDFRAKSKALTRDDWLRVVYRQPGLVRMLQAEPQLMPLVKDDAANLKGVEWAMHAPWHAFTDEFVNQFGTFDNGSFNLGIVPRQFIQANPWAVDMLATSPEDKQQLLDENQRAIAGLQRAHQNKDYGDSGPVSTATIATMRMLPFLGLDVGVARPLGGAIGAFIGGGGGAAAGVESGPGEAAAVPAGAVAGVGVGQFVGSGLFNYYEAVGPAHERFSQMKGANGKPLDPALVDAMTQATAISTGALMAGGGSIIGKSAGSIAKPIMAKFAADAIERAMLQPGMAGLMKRGLMEFGKDWLTGATLMGAQGLVNQVAVESAQVAADQHLTLGDVAGNPGTFALDVAANGHVDRMVSAGTNGFAGGFRDMWLLSLAGAGKGVISDLGRARASAENAVRYDTLIKAAAESKLLDRSPEVFAKTVAKMAEQEGAAGKVYVPFDRWVSYWQGKKVDPAHVAANIQGDGGAEYAKALANKGDLAFDTGRYLSNLAKTEHAEGLAPDVKMRPEDSTPNQFKERQEADQRKLKALVKRNPETESDRGEVRKFIRDMVMKSETRKPDEARELARANADMMDRVVTATAVRDNISIREAARQLNLDRLAITGPRGDKVLGPIRDRFLEFLKPRDEERLAKRLETMSPESRGREAFLDSKSGLREREVFNRTEVPEGKKVNIVTTLAAKGVNDNPAGGHNTTNDMLRALGVGVGSEHPEAAREGTNFFFHGTEGERLKAEEMARKSAGNEHLDVVGASGEDAEEAFKNLDAEVYRRRQVAEEGKPPPLPLKPGETALPKRGELHPALDVGALKFSDERAKGTVPEKALEEIRKLSDREYIDRFYVDKVKIEGEDKPTGLMTRKAFEALPPHKHVAMVDAKGLKAINDGFGKEEGNKFLFHLADTFAHFGGSSFSGTHLSGDEFVFGTYDATPERLQQYVEKVNAILKRAKLRLRDPATGKEHVVPVDFRHGIGPDLDAADRDLNTKKRAEPKTEVAVEAGVRRSAGDGLRGRSGDVAGKVEGAPEQGGSAREVGGGQDLELGNGGRSGLAASVDSGRGALSDSGGPSRQETPRPRGARRFFQEDVVAHIEGEPVVFSHGVPTEADAEFDFGQNETGRLVGDYVEGLPKKQQDAVKEFVAYCEGAEGAARPKDIPPSIEQELADKFGVADPNGPYAFDEAGRDMQRPLGGRKVFNSLPESLANWKQNQGGMWWQRYISPPKKRVKYFQFPRPEQSLDELERQQVFTDVAVAAGAKVVDSVDSLVDIMHKQVATLPERAQKSPLILVSDKDHAQVEFRDTKSAEKFIREFKDDILWVDVEPLRMDTRHQVENRNIDLKDQNRNQLDRMDFGSALGGDTNFSRVQPAVVRSRDTAEMAGREYLQDREGKVRPVDEIPASKDLPGQASAEAAPTPAERISGQPIVPDDYTGMLVLKAGGRGPSEKARGEIRMKLSPDGQPRSFNISAFAGDKSTLAHELSHFLSWSMHDMAESDLSTPQFKEDYAALLKWAGFKGTKERLFNAKEAEKLSAQGELTPGEMNKLKKFQAPEERISHGFEIYLAEGKAPNSALARVFSKFRGWMTKIYGGIEGIQEQYRRDYGEDVTLSNDVRDVFARLLGQDEAVRQAKEDVGETTEGPRPPPLPTLGMKPEERDAFYAALEAARVHEEQEVTQRMAEIQGEETEDIRAQVAQDVTRDLDRTTTYRAQRYLQLGELVDSDGNRMAEVPDVLLDDQGRPLKLDRKDFAKEYGKDVAALMPRGIWAKGGKKADEVAPLLGFRDGSDMVDAFRAVPAREKAIAEATQARVSQIYAPAQAELAKVAMSAVHNEHSARATLLQIRAIARTVDPATEARVNAVDPRVMKATAERLINESGVGDLDPDRYARDERQAATDAARLAGKGDKKAEVERRIDRLFSGMLWRAARDAATKAEYVEKKLQSTSENIRANLGKADPSYRDLHDRVLAAVGLGTEPPADAQGLDDFMKKASDDAHDPGEAFDVDALRRVLDAGRDWSQLSVAEATNVADAIQYIRHISRETNTVEVEGKRFGLAEYLRSVAARVALVQKPQPRMPYSKTAEGLKEKGRRARRGAQSLLENIETWAEMLDGGTSGPVHDLAIRSYVERRSVENELNKSVLKPIKEAWENVPKEIRKLKNRIEDVKDLLPVPRNAGTLEPVYTRDMLWRLFMAYGSEGNRQRLNTGNGWSNENIEKALSRLTPPELDFLQTVKDAINGLYPKLAEAYEKRTGLKLGKVDALPVTINGKTYAGGYDPIRYDSRISSQGEKQDISDAASISELFASQYQKPTLPNSSTKSRVEKVDAPLDLSWGVVPAHLSQVIRDISYGDWVRMVGRVMLAKAPKGVEMPTWKETTTKFLGEERAKEFVPWLRDVTNARADSASAQQSNLLRTIGNGARSTLARVALGFNFPSLARHLFDPYSTLADSDAVLPHHVFAAYVKVWNPGNWSRPEYALSQELSNHEAQLHENLKQELANIGPGGQSALGRALTSVAFYAHGIVHHFTARVVFTAGHDQALAEGATPEEAIQAGDDLVRRHIPSGDIATKPPILRTKYGAAAAVMYYGYANLMHNVRARAFDEVVRAYEGPNTGPMDAATATAKFAGKWIGLGMVGAVGTYFAGRAWKKKDDTPGGAAAWLGEEVGLDPVDGLPFGLGAGLKGLAKGVLHKDWPHEFDIANAPELAFAEDVFNRIEKGIQRAQSSGKTSDADKVWGMVEVLATAMAGAEGNRVVGDITAQRKGEYRPKGALGQAEGAVYGAPKKEPGESAVNPLHHLQRALKH